MFRARILNTTAYRTRSVSRSCSPRFDPQLVERTLLVAWPTLRAGFFRLRETTVYFPNGYAYDRLKNTLSLIEEGKMVVDELITHEFGHREAPEAYGMINEKSEEFLGIVIRWDSR